MLKQFLKTRTPIIVRILLINVIIIGVLHAISVIVDLNTTSYTLQSYTKLFDLDSEYNVPTFYSSALLLTVALMPWLLGMQTKRIIDRVFWTGFTLFFAYWAIDEMFVLHERLAAPIRKLLQIGYDSPFYHAWVLVALGVIGLFGLFLIIYHRSKLPNITKKQGGLLFIIFIYMLGIVLAEMLGTKLYDNTVLYRLVIVPLEELFEIGMVSYLIVRLLHYKD